jgi:hypothetical protein
VEARLLSPDVSDELLAPLQLLFVAGLDEGEARHLAARARAFGVLVNVEDVLPLCDFHVPAIVRHGDLLLTASTGGAAPGLSRALREHLLYLLKGGGAHATFDQAIADFPVSLRGKKPGGQPHTAWRILEHLRLAQWDILEFSRNAKHVSPDFPGGYWPKTPLPPSDAAWEKSCKGFQNDLKEMIALLKNRNTDLFAKIAHGDGQTILREALLLADHNAYHLGQIVDLRRALGAWPEE